MLIFKLNVLFSRYDNRYDDRDRGGRGYQQQPPARVEPVSQPGRYGNRSSRYDNYGDTVPPGTEPVGSNYDQYAGEYTERRVVVTIPSDNKREREREAAARDWERTRDRELETREKERIREYEEYHRGYRNTKSLSPRKVRSHERGKENKRGEGEAIEAINLRDQIIDQHKTVDARARVPVLVDLKKEPSVDREKKKEESSTIPIKEKEKKKEKDKKKKRKEEGEKKEKKKKRKEKKEGSVKAKSEEKMVPLKTIEGKPIVVGLKGDSAQIDPLYGDIEGTSVDKEVVQNYGKVDKKLGDGEPIEITDEPTAEVKENVVLAPVPELSKWELDEDMPSQDDKISGDDGTNSSEKKMVTSEVLKRAENAIFQKAINAIRPIDIAKKPVVPEKAPEKVKERKDVKDVPVKEPSNPEPIKITPETTSESREARKVANSIQITIPSHQSKVPERSVEIASATVSVDPSESSKSRSRLERSKVASVPVIPSSPVRVSAKERLGAKVDTDREEIRRVRSTVERKSRSRSPKRYFDRKYSDREKQREISPGGRRVVVSSNWSRDKEREESRRRGNETNKNIERRNEKSHDKEKDRRRDKRSRSSSRERKHKKDIKSEKIIIRKREEKPEERQVTVKVEQKKETSEKKVRKNPRLSSDRKKSILDEANFEPDYDESEPESEPEVPGEEKNLLVNVTLTQPSPSKKRSRSPSEEKEKKRLKSEIEMEKSPEKIAKEKDSEKVKKLEPDTDDSSDTDSSSDSSSDSSVDRKKRKKKKSKKRRKKKSKKRKDSSTDSESSDSSSSDSDTGKKKKKHKHRKKSSKSKKRKKSKHK